MNVLNLGLEGRYKFITHKADAEGNIIPGTEKVALEWFDNLITDTGLDLLGSSVTSNLIYCRLGTGNAAPAFTDTSLVAQVGSTNAGGLGAATGIAVDQTYVYNRVSRRFAAGTVSGVNLAEVGMSYTTTGNNLFSRALLRDTGGTPTTITLAADEVLDVIYELRAYIPQADVVDVMTIDGGSVSVTKRVFRGTNALNNWAVYVGAGFRFLDGDNGSAVSGGIAPRLWEGALPSITTGATWNTGALATTMTLTPYVAGTRQVTYVVTVGLTDGNFATGIGSITMGSTNTVASGANFNRPRGYFPGIGFEFSTKLNKTSSRTATFTAGIAWARHIP